MKEKEYGVKNSREYWEQEFDGYVCESLLDKEDTLGDHNFITIEEKLTDNVRDKVNAMCNNIPFTVFDLFLSSAYILLYKYTGKKDIVISTLEFDRDGKHKNKLIPFRYEIESEVPVKELLKKVGEKIVKGYNNQNILLQEIAKMKEVMEAAGEIFICYNQLYDFQGIDEKLAAMDNKLAILLMNDNDEMTIQIRTCNKFFCKDKKNLQKLLKCYIKCVEQIIVEKKSFVRDVVLVSDEDMEFIENYNHVPGDYQYERTLESLFVEAAEKYPDLVAIIDEAGQMTYEYLDKKSNQIANYLIQQGIRPGDFVGVLNQRVCQTICNILGIIKAGAAYVPIDDTYPQERISYIIKNSNCKMLLHKDFYKVNHLEELSEQDSKVENSVKNLAYIIYTSGSTGNPKGVSISHSAAVNTIIDINQRFKVTTSDRIIGLSSMCFDLSVYDIFGALQAGACLVMVQDQKNVELIHEVLDKYQITIWNSVPAIMEMLVNHLDDKYINTTLRAVLMSGDWIPIILPDKIRKHFENVEMWSLGGATEASIWSIHYPINKVEKDWTSIPYGMPLTNQEFYVMNTDLQPKPIGFIGELFIGGVGVAEGYLNDREKTEHAFINHERYGKIYRTGDYGRLSSEGYIIFEGRKDEQVKIHGFRVELGEIESRILENEKIRNAVVVPIKFENGSYNLCAYVVADEEIDFTQVKHEIGRYLPSYMIPPYFIQLSEIPLTSNGKVDVKTLKNTKEIQEIQEELSKEYVEPASTIEKMLASAWCQVLGIEKIGVNDNFFLMGGDSLKAIQLISILKKSNYKISMQKLFEYPTISQLSTCLADRTIDICQEPVVGEMPLAPIQARFLDMGLKNKDQFTMYIVLKSDSEILKEFVESSFDALLEKHDALRILFQEDNGKLNATNRDTSCKCYHLQEFGAAADSEALQSEAIIQELSKDISIESKNLISVGIVNSGTENLLYILIHHLIIDGVSWRFLLEDLNTVYSKLLMGEEIEIPLKTSSYKEWSQAILSLANTNRILEQKDYWKGVLCQDIITLADSEVKLENSTGICRSCLSEEVTENLLRNSRSVYKTEINDLLLSALELALKKWNKIGKVMVNLEGHGREELIEDIDISRTVGWFTSIFPIILKTDIEENISNRILRVKEMLRKIPDKGVGYNILKYITDRDLVADMDFSTDGTLGFNYLGEMDAREENQLQLHTQGSYVGENDKSLFAIDFNTIVVNKHLCVDISYKTELFSEEQIQVLLRNYISSLEEIVLHCMNMQNELGDGTMLDEESIYQPDVCDEENLYESFPLTDVQMAYLLGRSEEYEMGGVSTHMYLEMETKFDMERFQESMNKVIERHPMMRVGINPSGYQYFRKEQLIYKVEMKDLTNASEEEIVHEIEQERARMSHFVYDTEQWPMFEFKAYKLNETTNYMFIGYDLLMCDATSMMQIIFKELLLYYNDPETVLPKLKYTFRDYIFALNKFKASSPVYQEDKKYWMRKLDDFPRDFHVPYKQDPKQIVKPHFERLTWILDKDKWTALKNMARQKGITPSVLLGTAYAQVLAFWGNQSKLAINLTVFNRLPFSQEVSDIVGDFTSIILLDIALQKSMDFWENAYKVQGTILSALDHRHFDGVEFMRELSKKHNTGTSVVMPFVFTSMVFNNISNDLEQLGEMKWSVSQTPQVYIDNQVMESQGKLIISWDYVEQIFDEEVIHAMFDQYTAILEGLLNGMKKFVLELPIQEKNLLHSYNDTKVVQTSALLHELFQEKADEFPDNIAITYNGETLTYLELDALSNQIANYLKEQGVCRHSFVGVMVDRRPYTIANMLGILKTGAAYIPIEPYYPKNRRDYILENANATLLLDETTCQKARTGEYSSVRNELCNAVDDVAYVIYTSGSTGKPKGVVITHKGAVNTILDVNRKYSVCESDRIIALSSMCFDLSVYDIFGSLGAGATLVMVDDQRDALDIIDILKKQKITIWNSVPAIMDMTVKAMSNLEDSETEKRYYWSSVMDWSINDDTLIIHGKEYEVTQELRDIFPEIYFTAQQGIEIRELMDKFSYVDHNELQDMIDELITSRVLVDSILEPAELFTSQDHLLNHNYGSNLLIDAEAGSKFKNEKLNRYVDVKSSKGYIQLGYCQYPKQIEKRRTYRVFEEEKKISFPKFNKLLSVFYQKNIDTKKKFLYASAGGLYPVDMYLYVKAGRVENVEQGLYLYNPVYNTLEIIDNEHEFTDISYYYTNKQIFHSSAFSIYFVYNAEVSMPKYGGMGYYYSAIDTGIMVGLLTNVAELLNMAVCSIGDMNFDTIKDCFHLTKHQKLIHTVECGLKSDEDELANELEEIELIENAARQQRKDNPLDMTVEDSEYALRLVILSGDWIPLKLPNEIRKYFENAEVISMGGATEASIWSIYYPVEEVDKKWKSIPYGYPLANQQMYILDETLAPCPIGIKGEIYIGGDGVAVEYQNNEEKTTEAFIIHPEYGKIYKTGDYGVMTKEGYMVFLGRLDNQVKIRGYRIELGEIENCLLKVNGVENVLVDDYVEPSGKKSLCAYYTGTCKDNLLLRKRAEEELTAYMVPSYFVHVDSFPLTSNGKVNRKELPLPVKHEKENRASQKPQNMMENELVEMWKEILQLNEVGIHDSFFDLGGYSVQATIMLAKIKKQYNVNVPLREVFKTPTIEKITSIIKQEQIKQTKSKKEGKDVHRENKDKIVLLRKVEGSDKNLFFIHDVTGEISAYTKMCAQMKEAYNCWAIRFDQLQGVAPVYLEIKEVALDYIERMKSIQKHGPYAIAGWSMGGAIGLEVVRQLEAMGDEVEYFGAIDAITPEKGSEVNKEKFTLDSELEIIQKIVPNSSEIFEVTEDTTTEHLWEKVITFCEANSELEAMLKDYIMKSLGDLYWAIPDVMDCNTRRLVHYVNVIRSVSNLYYGYLPENCIQADVHFYKATGSIYNTPGEKWVEFTTGEVYVTNIEGTHFSIFEGEGLVELLNYIRMELIK